MTYDSPSIIKERIGWQRDKRLEFESQFYSFLDVCPIQSAELGKIFLGQHLWRSQRRFYNSVFDGLEKDKHDNFHTKSRRLGVSGGTRALVTFWMGMFEGTRGAMIYDTSGHKEEARIEILDMVKSIPGSVKFPRIVRENRDFLELENGSLMVFMAAGVKETKTSGTLGRSSGFSLVHASEVCSFSSAAGIESFIQSLAQHNPNRQYIWESTGRSFNIWWSLWQEAKKDPDHKQCLFTGWWGRDDQIISRDDPDFEKYGVAPPSQDEKQRIDEVLQRYEWQITSEQLAWIRRRNDPSAQGLEEGLDYSSNYLRLQEQAWTEDDVFLFTGSTFFDAVHLTNVQKKTGSNKFQAHRYEAGLEFTDCKIFPSRNLRSTELKVWEEPLAEAVYVIACDPAHGSNENNDRSAIQVLRCYADGIDQVAEYAWPLIGTKQLAWVLLSLCAWYATYGADIYMILELQGGGDAVWDEVLEVKRLINGGYLRVPAQERGLQSIITNVKNYVYSHNDSMSNGRSWQFKTTGNLKVKVMERLRDYFNNGMLVVRSLDLLEEMKSITREGDKIEAEGSAKDDRVMAMALGVHCWEQRARRILAPIKRTREADQARRRGNPVDVARMFNKSQLQTLFDIKSRARKSAAQEARRSAWARKY